MEARTSPKGDEKFSQQIFPVTHSILSAEALLTEVSSHYELGTPLACTLLKPKLNDTYLVRTEQARYILRVYRTPWRSLTQIHYELDWLLHLSKKGVAVSSPLARKDGSLVGTVLAPEGKRHVVMFTYAPGKPFYGEAMAANSHLLGQVVATLHLASQDFTTQHERVFLDLNYLVDQQLEALSPLLVHRQEDWNYLMQLSQTLHERLTPLIQQGLSWGVCHGDLISANAHVTADQIVTFFDFDCCGPGWIASDLAAIRTLARWLKKDRQMWNAFLRGYTEKGRVTDADLKAVPLFVAAGVIWSMGLHAANGADWGIGQMDDDYFDEHLQFLRKWEAEQLEGKRVFGGIKRYLRSE